jgi:cell division protease FtsH
MNPGENKPQAPQIPRWIWLLALAALVAWNFFLLRPKSNPSVNIPYSTFIDQVRAGNVKSVQISGNSITGVFNTSIVWPTSTPGAAPSGTPTAAAPTATPQTYADFRTYFPSDVGDTRLLPLLEQENVVVNVSAPPTPWLTILLSYGLPILAVVGVMVWMGRRATAGRDSGIFGFGRTQARRYEGSRVRVTFDDVAGADEAKADLEEIVDFLRDPAKYHSIGARIPRGVLLVGPPGTGKTLMARAIAGEARVPFFSLSASEFVEMFVGVGASRVRDLFGKAQEAAPAIVFIDELDAVGRRRGAGLGNTNDEREQTLNQLLVEMDGFDDRHEVIVIAATNRPDVLDPALLRPGRFDRQVTISLPDLKGREGILEIHTRHLQLGSDVDLGIVARTTTGFSGADLANLCNEAALFAARQNRRVVAMTDFEEAVDKVILGGVRSLLLNDEDRRVIAYHEAGHALVAWRQPEADPVRKVTIIPRGQALGVTEQLPEEDHYNQSRGYLLARLAVMLGGRTAEELVMDDITTGAESDLVQATRLARRMVTRWAMGGLGMMAFESDEQQPFLGYELAQGHEYSEETATRIDEQVEQLLNERHKVAHQILSEQREALDALVQRLLSEETVDQEELERILGSRPAGAEPDQVAPEPAPDQGNEVPNADKGSADGNPAADGAKRVSTEPRPYG